MVVSGCLAVGHNEIIDEATLAKQAQEDGRWATSMTMPPSHAKSSMANLAAHWPGDHGQDMSRDFCCYSVGCWSMSCDNGRLELRTSRANPAFRVETNRADKHHISFSCE